MAGSSGDAGGFQRVEKHLRVGEVGTRFAVVAGAAEEVVLGVLVVVLVPLQLLEERDGVADDRLVLVVLLRFDEGHHVDAGDVVVQLDLRVPFARDVLLLGVDQAFDVLERLLRDRILRRVLPRLEQARQGDAGDARRLVGAPAPLGVLRAKLAKNLAAFWATASQVFLSGPTFGAPAGSKARPPARQQTAE